MDREEEEIIGPLPAGDGGDADDLLNFDTVSEKVDLGLEGGNAVISVKVRCERIVPIRGAADMFKKSSVIVTRIIEIDLQVGGLFGGWVDGWVVNGWVDGWMDGWVRERG